MIALLIVIVALVLRGLQDRNAVVGMGAVPDTACMREVVRCSSGAGFTEIPELRQDGKAT
jgi:hypothetical protein